MAGTSHSSAAVLNGAREGGSPPTAVHVVQIRPPGYVHAEALTEVAESVYHGLRRLGLKAFYHETPDRPARAIVFGAHLLDQRQLAALPSNAIIYNSEQVDATSPWMKGPYAEALVQRSVWDYSSENVGRLTALGARSARYVPLGYVPELRRIPPVPEDIDVLFYGSINDRRLKMLEGLRARGLKVAVLFGSYGTERDRVIARAKVVLSIHYYPAKIFEAVRAAYLFANAKAVVADCDVGTSIDPDLRDALCGVPYQALIAACVGLVGDPIGRAALAARGHRIFAQRRAEHILAAALGVPVPPIEDAPAGESFSAPG